MVCTACSRGCSNSDQPPTGASAAPSAAPAPAPTPTASAPVELPPETPQLPPQLVACQGRKFYRITRESLQTFEASRSIPPPQIRGSQAAGQINEFKIEQPLNVLAGKDAGVLVVAKSAIHELGSAGLELKSGPAIPTSKPLFAWLEAKPKASLWVRRLDQPLLTQYALSGASSNGAAQGLAPARELPLADFDGRLFAVLQNGTPLYSSAKGLRRPNDTRLLPLPQLSRRATLIFGDASPAGYWAANDSGQLELWAAAASAPSHTARVPGVVIDAASDGDRVVVLSLELKTHSYQPTLTIFVAGQQNAQIPVGPVTTYLGLPKLDLCLIPERPWVVVGTPHWLHLLDWATPRLLAEW